MLRRFFAIIFGAAALCAAVSAALSLRQLLSLSNSNQISARVRNESPHTPDGAVSIWSTDAENALNATLESIDIARSSVPSDINEALSATQEWLGAKAALETDLDRRVKILCLSLSQYGKSLEYKPRDPAFLMGWTELRQVLGSVRCTESRTEGDFEAVLEIALKAAPYDHDVLFRSAVLLALAGKTDRAFSVFKRLLMYTPNLSSGEEEIILRQLTSGADLASVIPARFPQIIRWSELLKEKRVEHFHAWSAQIGALQKQAMAEAKNRAENRELSMQLYEKELTALFNVASLDSIRQQIDNELADIVSANSNYSAQQFFAERGRLRKLAIIPAQIAADTRANVSPLTQWGGDAAVYIDQFNQSVGFFLAADQSASLLVLRSSNGQGDLKKDAIRVYGSADNQQWEEVDPQRTDGLVIDDNSVFAITTPTESYRYWKINYASGDRSKKFGAPLEDLLTVYGYSTRAD